jgi:hypothetical protein
VLPWIIALVGVIALIGLLAFARRRHRDDSDENRTSSMAVGTAGGAARERREATSTEALEPTRGQQTVVPDADEAVDFNIFEVNIVDGAALRVGYNYFPEGTQVRWRITRDGTVKAVGDFVTYGGGSSYHFVTMPLDVALGPDQGGTEVYFAWVIGGVPFEYSVLGQQIG